MKIISYLCSVKKTLILLICLTACVLQAQVVRDSAWRDDVKTVQLYRSGAELDFPVLGQNSGRLVLEFDVLRAESEDLRWRLLHCDRTWVPDGLEDYEFMTGFAEGPMEAHDYSFTTRRDYVHYRTVIPGDYATFVLSGNYVVEVSDGEGEVLLRRRFCVSEQSAKVHAEVVRPYDGVALERRQEVDVKVESGEWRATGNPDYLHVVVQQNGRDDNRRELQFSGYDGAALCFRQRPCNIFDGGNTFRFFDCSNLHTPMYNLARVEEYGGELFALLKPEEDRSRKHYLSETTLAGGMKVNIQERQNPRLEAEYVWVNFSLPMAQPMLEGSVYIVGALTDWRMDSASRMDYRPEYRAYTKRLLLKQGYYAYQLLVATEQGNSRGGRSATALLEGDHRETPNLYTVYVYHRSPSDLADRLLAVVRIKP